MTWHHCHSHFATAVKVTIISFSHLSPPSDHLSTDLLQLRSSLNLGQLNQQLRSSPPYPPPCIFIPVLILISCHKIGLQTALLQDPHSPTSPILLRDLQSKPLRNLSPSIQYPKSTPMLLSYYIPNASQVADNLAKQCLARTSAG